MTTPATKPLHTWITTLNTLLPLLTAAGFIATIIFLTSVFDEWGLSIIQLIEPGEVLLPSLGLASILILTASVALVAHRLFELLFGKLKLAPKVYISATLVVVLAPIWIPGWLHFPVWAQAIATMLALGCAANTVASLLSLRGSSLTTLVAALIAFSPLPTWWATAWNLSTQMLVTHGFSSGVSVRQSDGAPCDGKVLWLGAKMVVIRCTDPKQDVQLMPFKDDLKLIHHTRTRP